MRCLAAELKGDQAPRAGVHAMAELAFPAVLCRGHDGMHGCASPPAQIIDTWRPRPGTPPPGLSRAAKDLCGRRVAALGHQLAARRQHLNKMPGQELKDRSFPFPSSRLSPWTFVVTARRRCSRAPARRC